MKKKKIKFSPGNCPYCYEKNVFMQLANIQMVLDYAKRNFCCYKCAVKAFNSIDEEK